MPIYLRTFYFKRLQKHFKDEAEEMKKARQKNKSSLPSYKKWLFWYLLLNNSTQINLMENYNG